MNLQMLKPDGPELRSNIDDLATYIQEQQTLSIARSTGRLSLKLVLNEKGFPFTNYMLHEIRRIVDYSSFTFRHPRKGNE